MSTTDSGPAASGLRSIAVGSQLVRIAVRPARRGWRSRPAEVPLLLINGIGASLELLQPFVDELDPALEVIRFDVPGVGGSPLPDGPYRFTGLCRLISQMLTQLGHDRADVLGVSWGGAVAQHFAAFQRSRCRKLVLVSTATGMIMVPARPSVLVRMATPRRYLDRGYLESVAAALYGGSARADPGQVTAAMNAHNRVGSPRGYLYQLTAGLGWTSVPFLPRLRQPTLILSGDDDPLIPLANARLMHRLIPNSQLQVFHGGHLGLVTEAAQLGPVVSRFLAEPLFGTAQPGSNRDGAARSQHDEGSTAKGDLPWIRFWTRTSTRSSNCSTQLAAGSSLPSGSSWRNPWGLSSTTTGQGRSFRTTCCPDSPRWASPGRPTRATAALAAAACSTA
jgi:poly(3-hydroxyalkanoate) depolymerase